MAETLRLESPAKVNLRLEILRKREDGYHEIRTILQKISLLDTIHFSLKRGKGIFIKADRPDLPTGRSNLVYKAIQSMMKESDYEGGIHVQIEKRIPIGAGLGGGSSDAAATLTVMNQLLKLNLSRKRLREKGLEIGADVPFFFLEGAAIGSGIGERLKKIELPNLWYVLIYPNFEVSTKWAYRNFVLTNQRIDCTLHKFLKGSEGIPRILFNHLESVVSEKYPQINIMKGILSSVGAMGALMTGSGPTVFGLFQNEKSAAEAYERVKKLVARRGWTVFKAHGIP